MTGHSSGCNRGPLDLLATRAFGAPRAAIFLAPLCAAVVCALFLGNGIRGPFDAQADVANFFFWLAAGMAIGWLFRKTSFAAIER